MYIIAGLGNPGKEYSGTRHNAGFIVVDAISEKYGIAVTEKKHKALIGKGVMDGNKVILVKPQTFMNLSGESLREVMDYYKADPESELIVIYDDIALPPGDIRVRKRGSAGGHNGMKNIIANLGTQDYIRVRMGVGEKPPRTDLKDWVLGHMGQEDREAFSGAVESALEAILTIMEKGADEAMNRFNKKVGGEV
ncbi:MAG: aminoacyl-tRNA hydrolase [Lachnospiraceae bacterium]|nr:aminoacyl-tRNA hydrolase [Lachnospiraceae bacterium]